MLMSDEQLKMSVCCLMCEYVFKVVVMCCWVHSLCVECLVLSVVVMDQRLGSGISRISVFDHCFDQHVMNWIIAIDQRVDHLDQR
jgi:hypothetical protein